MIEKRAEQGGGVYNMHFLPHLFAVSAIFQYEWQFRAAFALFSKRRAKCGMRWAWYGDFSKLLEREGIPHAVLIEPFPENRIIFDCRGWVRELWLL